MTNPVKVYIIPISITNLYDSNNITIRDRTIDEIYNSFSDNISPSYALKILRLITINETKLASELTNKIDSTIIRNLYEVYDKDNELFDNNLKVKNPGFKTVFILTYYGRYYGHIYEEWTSKGWNNFSNYLKFIGIRTSIENLLNRKLKSVGNIILNAISNYYKGYPLMLIWPFPNMVYIADKFGFKMDEDENMIYNGVNTPKVLFLDNERFKNKIKTVPRAISYLTNLRKLDLSHNHIKIIPEWLGNLTNLQLLYLDHNEIEIIPESLSKLTDLEELTLSNNKIKNIPESLRNLKKYKLEFVSLYNNIENLVF